MSKHDTSILEQNAYKSNISVVTTPHNFLPTLMVLSPVRILIIGMYLTTYMVIRCLSINSVEVFTISLEFVHVLGY